MSLGYHSGKYDTGHPLNRWEITPKGDRTDYRIQRQTRLCSECGAMEVRDTTLSTTHSPAWAGKDAGSDEK